MSNFVHLSLGGPLLRALAKEGYEEPTLIQSAAIPQVLKNRDVLAIARTGTGKTAAFALPLLQRLSERAPKQSRGPRALVLTPTRELALQIQESFQRYGCYLPLTTAVVLGGVSMQTQISALRKKPDILVATPGRLLDLLSQRQVRLTDVEVLVLDEADRMLDMGFLPDVRRIAAATPASRQTMLFSATIPEAIAAIAAELMHDPARVEAAPSASVSDDIEQRVLFVEREDKRALLASVLRDKGVQRALVFTRTKHRADRIARALNSDGIAAQAIHGNKTQSARQRVLSGFRSGRIKVLVATDVVSRGIDVEGISHVINYELPADSESYVHRIGRTARAGATGKALSLCDAEEIALLKGIEKLTTRMISVENDHPYHSDAVAALREKQQRGPAAGKRTPRTGRAPRSGQRPARAASQRLARLNAALNRGSALRD